MLKLSFPCKPKIISVHIPKTGGISFSSALRKEWGNKFLHIRGEDKKKFNDGASYRYSSPFVKVVHGHIRPHQNWKNLYPNAKWVCWLRDPMDRTVSAYYHLEKNQHKGGDRNKILFQEIQPSLEQFIADPRFHPTVNIYQHYLSNFSPEDFTFIGRTEFYDEDLATMSKILRIDTLTQFRENTGKKRKPISDDKRNELKAILKDEYLIYHKFLSHFHDPI